jgi:hypothetical protein
MPESHGVHVLLAVFAAITVWYIARWWGLERGRGRLRELRAADLAVGCGTNFFDTLGIGCFAPTTAIYKLQHRMPTRSCRARSTSVMRCPVLPRR